MENQFYLAAALWILLILKRIVLLSGERQDKKYLSNVHKRGENI